MEDYEENHKLLRKLATLQHKGVTESAHWACHYVQQNSACISYILLDLVTKTTLDAPVVQPSPFSCYSLFRRYKHFPLCSVTHPQYTCMFFHWYETSFLFLGFLTGDREKGTSRSRVRASWIYVNNCPTRCNYIQFIYVCKLLYMFRVVSPSIIRSSCHCIHTICSSHPVTFMTGCSYSLTSARWCGHSDMSSWWWVEIPPQTCRAIYRHK
jgi:hypothetical protein